MLMSNTSRITCYWFQQVLHWSSLQINDYYSDGTTCRPTPETTRLCLFIQTKQNMQHYFKVTVMNLSVKYRILKQPLPICGKTRQEWPLLVLCRNYISTCCCKAGPEETPQYEFHKYYMHITQETYPIIYSSEPCHHSCFLTCSRLLLQDIDQYMRQTTNCLFGY